jgi:nucleotide-binding universal stress UspA family protein
MWLTKKILVATDFAAPAQAAADVGLQLAQEFHVPLVLVHAYIVPGSIVPLAPVLEYARIYTSAARELLEKECHRLAGRGVEVIAVLRSGVAWEEILRSAKELDADVIIMGTHGRRGVLRALLGSVAEKVVRLSTVPVLTIHGSPDGVATKILPDPAPAS